MSLDRLKIKCFAPILLLGFASGLPLALCASTLQAWFTTTGVSLQTIGMLSLVGQPYVYKFLWAPLLDYYIPPFGGRRRGWLIITQLAIIAGLITMAIVGAPATHPYQLICLATLVAFFSATQDIAVDAYRTEIAPVHERGNAAALNTIGYRVAMMVSGGLALIAADKLGWATAYYLMAACMAVGLYASLIATEPELLPIKQRPESQDLWTAFKAPLHELMTRPAAALLLLFIVLYKLGDALSVSLLTTFLLRGLGFSLTLIGSVLKGVGLFATLAGALLAGAIMLRLSLYRALFIFGVLQIIAIGSLLLLACVGHNVMILIICVSLDNLCNGMGSTALVALLMSCCDARYTATQYAMLAAVSAVGRVFIGPLAGLMASYLGWPSFFGWAIVCSLPALILLHRLKPALTSTALLKHAALVIKPVQVD